jgi:hypothetical protein
MNRAEALHYLTHDPETGEPTGHLSVPCSRWGRNGADCAEVAYDLDVILSDATGEGMDARTLDGAMSAVVNDHDDVAYTFAQYGAEYPAEYSADMRERWGNELAATLRDKYEDEIADWGDADAYNETGNPQAREDGS